MAVHWGEATTQTENDSETVTRSATIVLNWTMIRRPSEIGDRVECMHLRTACISDSASRRLEGLVGGVYL